MIAFSQWLAACRFYYLTGPVAAWALFDSGLVSQAFWIGVTAWLVYVARAKGVEPA